MLARVSKLSAVMLLGVALTQMSLGAAGPSLAQGVASPAAPYEIVGFRSAKFGMSEADVRAAVANDFGAVTMTPNANPVEGTSALQVTVDHMDPGPGPAEVTYIFGALSHTLAHINVVWTTGPSPTAEQRAAIITAGLQLSNYFQTRPQPLKATLAARPSGPNSLMLFAGVDQKGAGIEIAAEGISYEIADKTNAKKSDSPAPAGPALLRISYIRNVANPDIMHIKPGAF
jgi:hypothetical protein